MYLTRSSGAYAADSDWLVIELLEATNDLVAAIDRDGRFVALNAAFCAEFSRTFGTSLRLGQAIDDVLVHLPRDRAKARALFARALSGEAFTVEQQFGTGERSKWFELRFQPMAGSDGRFCAAAIVARDLSERRAAEGDLLEASPDAMLIMCSNGTIHRMNSLAERMFGYAPGALEGKCMDLLVPERFRGLHAQQREGYLRSPRTRPMGGVSRNLVGLRADGSEFPVEISLNPLRIGDELRVAAAIRDVTERRQAFDELERRVSERTAELHATNVELAREVAAHQSAERSLEEAVRESRATFEQAAVGIAHVTPDGRWLHVNQRMCEILGYDREELLSMNLQDVTYPDDLPRAQAQILRVLSGEISSYSMEKRSLRKQGDTVWVNLTVSLVRDAGGAPRFFILVVEDIDRRKEAERQLRDSEERFRTLADQLKATFEHSAVGIVHLGMPERRFLRVNDAFCRITGYSSDELLAMTAPDLTHPDDRLLGDPLYARLMRGEIDSFTLEKRYVRKDGRTIWARTSLSAVRQGESRLQFVISVIEDISAEKLADQARQEAERRLELAVGIAELGFFEWEVGSRDIYWSPLFKRQLGYADEELPNRFDEWEARLHPDDRGWVLESFVRYAERPDGEFEIEYRLLHRAGDYRWFVAQAIPEFGPSGKVLKLIGTHLDVTDRKLAEQRVREAALHDPLTGLPNRALVFEYASHLLAAARRNHSRGALLFVDLDRFKPINDLYGHEIGDRLLQEVAKRLLGCTRQEDLVGRLGGDEFVIVLPYLDKRFRSVTVAQHVIQAIRQPFYIGNLELSVSPSIGISHYPDHGTDVDTLIHSADLAMYRAKQGGRSDYHFFSPELDRRADEQHSIEAQLKQALKGGGLHLHYQPVIDMKSGRLVGAEALLRLAGDDGQLIPPDHFIPVAESAGLIGPLGEWVAAEACRQHDAWLESGLPPVTIAINVSPLQFRQRAFAKRLEAIVAESGINPACLQVEVTESSVMESVDDAIRTLHRIKSLGIRVALDDFGTGYSSLSQLSNLPLDKLKVDQSFVRRVVEDRTSRAITEAIIALGRTLHLEVVGEGIESEQALAYLREHGCDQAQGYLFSPPLPAARFHSWYAEHVREFMH